MTIYEQIQQAIDFIEENLFSHISCELVAAEANMSLRSFYNYFWTLSGFTYKEYLKKRRLSESLKILSNTENKIIEIALRTGYESHEAFSRAFKEEFGVSPLQLRKKNIYPNGIEKIMLIAEMYMGVIIKKIPTMKVICFDGFKPNPEENAFKKMEKWLEVNNIKKMRYRVFGHNIDYEGNMSYEPQNVGYKVNVTIDDEIYNVKNADGVFGEINQGTFVVTGIEGNFEKDPTGKWIMDGWDRLNKMIEKKGYNIKKPLRYYEEVLEPSVPQNFRIDLYLEIE